ncbi:MAG: CHAT domain-containing protein, partial [Phaeodactylibacter sp.]|nr:CHAT domain-containing protein [Phaeodactylibacter sp.]
WASVADELGKKLLFQRPLDAEHYSQMALGIRKRLFESPFHQDVLRMYYNIGSAHFLRKNYHQAISYFDSAGVRLLKGLPQLFILSHLKLGQAYQEIGELNNALFHYQIASDSMEVYPISPKKQLEMAWSLSSCYRLLREYDKGIERAGAELNRPGPEGQNIGIANLYLVLGNIWQDSLLASEEEEAGIKAASFIQKALSSYENAPEGPQKEARIARAASNLGELYRRAGQLGKATQVLTDAINLLKNQDELNNIFVPLYINRGESHFGRRQYEAALVDYDSALLFLAPSHPHYAGRPLPPASSYEGNHRRAMALLADIALANLALSEEKKGEAEYLKNAVAAYDTLYRLINHIRGDFISDEAKLELAAGAQETLSKAFEGCLKLYRKTNDPTYKEQAFRISEQSKAFVLLEAARLKNVSSMLPETARRQEEELLLARARLKGQLLENWNDPVQKKELKKELSRNFENIRAFQRQLREDYPNYFALKYQGAELSSTDIRKELLKPGQSLIEYFQLDSALYIFLLNQDSLSLETVPVSRRNLDRQVSRFRLLLQQGQSQNQNEEDEFCRLAQSLYDKLLAPAEDKLSGRLIIIPAGSLNNLPFEALLKSRIPGGIAQQANAGNFVLFNHSVSYCFSANLLSLMQPGPKGKSGGDKGMAVFVSAFNHSISRNAGHSALPPALLNVLPYLTPLGVNQETEVKKIRETIPNVKVYEQEAASKEEFLKACRQYSIIHVPTHGILNEGDPGFSFISFSQLGEQIDLSELLFVKDLYAQHWNLDLLFLSACQTATGRFMEGEGNISLARGMAYAGVRSLATTLWNVPTAAKARIAPAFYRYLLQDEAPKDEALARAKREVARRHHPNDWAGLILIGATD